jgi:hypothetical protein
MDVLIADGFQVPVIPFVEDVGRVGGAEFWQSCPIAANVGVIRLFIVTDSVAVVAHSPFAGVNV